MDIKKKLEELERAHGYKIVDETYQGSPVKTIVCVCGNRYGMGQSHVDHVVGLQYKLVLEAQALIFDATVDYLELAGLGSNSSGRELLEPLRHKAEVLRAEARG